MKQVKDLNFQNYIVKSELEKYKKTVEKINKDNLKNKGVNETKFLFSSERNLTNKKTHKKKNVVSLSNKLENNEYIKKILQLFQ